MKTATSLLLVFAFAATAAPLAHAQGKLLVQVPAVGQKICDECALESLIAMQAAVNRSGRVAS